MWEYDDGGNILSRKKYAYTTGNLGAPTETVNYGYGNANWGDLLTSYNGSNISYDTIGNVLNDGTRTYTWEHGRELTALTKDGIAWSYTYDANGMRTQRASNYATYRYFYNGGLLVRMTKDSAILRFTYDASGMPMSVVYGGEEYFYATNLQGDVVALLDGSGDVVVRYTYDAWGNVLSTTGDLADTLGSDNPLRYRGYVYDSETGLYYLQSRYYNPETGRFLNADVLISTGQGLLGYNMFAYCNNNPVRYCDPSGYELKEDSVKDTPEEYLIPDPEAMGPSSRSNVGGTNGGNSADQSTPIYRYGGKNPGNLTPKAKDRNSGLSFSTQPKPGALKTTIGAINSTGVVVAIQDGPYHVSVKPKGATVDDWIYAGPSSVWTRAVRSVIME